PTQLVTALAEAHCQGVHIDWERVLAAPGADPRPVELPTYPFRGRRYWLPTPRALTDPTDLGIRDAGHPLLGARVPVADTGRTIFTGRLDAGQHPWLVEHALGDRALLPGTAMVDLLPHVGREATAQEIAEL